MSKRYIFPEQYGESKRAKLNITISDHNFPLSQNAGPSKENNVEDNWGDENDDEILLLASQACEQAYAGNISLLPDYSICMQPASTSTQIDPQPSTSKTQFTFKMPSTNSPSAISTKLKDKCDRISSPLPGISKAMLQVNEQVNLTDDLIFSDKICKGQGSDYIYRQLLQLQEENAKLKSENGKLLEKCVTKEGESSILRTQLKSCQAAIDNARLERVRAQEKVQLEWTDKVTTADNQIRDLRTQLDFKNLEIISIKERCRMLESSKVKLTQVTVAANDISSSHRQNNECASQLTRRVKTTSHSVQTEHQALLLTLNKTYRTEKSRVSQILPLLTEPTLEQYSILECNENLRKHMDYSQNKCRIFNTFHRIPRTAAACSDRKKCGLSINCIYEDIAYIAMENGDVEAMEDKYSNVVRVTKSVLLEVEKQLEAISVKLTTSFQKEMDEKYIEATNSYIVVDTNDLLRGRALYKEEQAILARRLTAILAVLETSRRKQHIQDIEVTNQSLNRKLIDVYEPILSTISKICELLDHNCCAILYSGLILSILCLISALIAHVPCSSFYNKCTDALKCVITSRCMPFVFDRLLMLLTQIKIGKLFPGDLCPDNRTGNLKVDYDQGVLLYKKDSCVLQIFLKQLEVVLKCVEKQALKTQVLAITRNLMSFYNDLDDGHWKLQDKPSCECRAALFQVIVYALSVCAGMMNKAALSDTGSPGAGGVEDTELMGTCRCGLQLLYSRWLRDVEFSTHLKYNEGHLVLFCELVDQFQHPDIYANMLSELTGSFQSSPEDTPPSFHRQAWINSFQNFSLTE